MLRLFTGEAVGVVRFIDLLMPLLALPALVLLPLTLLARKRRMAISLAPTEIALILIYGGLFIPRAAVNTAPDLTVMSFNILNGNHKSSALAQTIRDSNADVVLLQETTEYQVLFLTSRITDLYPYTSIHVATPNRLGLGVYSRYPLLVDDYSAYQPESSRLRLQIDVKGTTVTIYTVHLANPLIAEEAADPNARSEGVSGLLDMLANQSGALIVAGDFNMTDLSTDYGRMSARLIDSVPRVRLRLRLQLSVVGAGAAAAARLLVPQRRSAQHADRGAAYVQRIGSFPGTSAVRVKSGLNALVCTPSCWCYNPYKCSFQNPSGDLPTSFAKLITHSGALF